VSALVVRGLVKGFGTHAVLRGLDLTVEPGSITSILGSSGSGKTTLLRVLCGFERSEQGSIVLDGDTVDDRSHYVPPERRRIGYVPQDGNLFPHLTIAGNIRFGLGRGAQSRQRVSDLLDMIGLADRARSYPHQLSGGQRWRWTRGSCCSMSRSPRSTRRFGPACVPRSSRSCARRVPPRCW
jgi:iron(III) transport system ATP-binding protein